MLKFDEESIVLAIANTVQERLTHQSMLWVKLFPDVDDNCVCNCVRFLIRYRENPHTRFDDVLWVTVDRDIRVSVSDDWKSLYVDLHDQDIIGKIVAYMTKFISRKTQIH